MSAKTQRRQRLVSDRRSFLSSCIKLHDGETDFEINSIQAQSIDAQFLPRGSVGSRFEHVSTKCDFALATVDKNGYGDMELSQMADGYTSTLCLPCPIVVKQHGGNAGTTDALSIYVLTSLWTKI